MKEQKEAELKEKSLKYSIKEGSATSLMSGAGEAYVVPFAIALNATNSQIGFLSSFVGLLGASSQVVSSKLVYSFKRKKIVLFGVALQATIWLLMIALGILAFKGIINQYAASILIVIYCMYAIIGNAAGPAWFSWMGDLVPERKRGEYFSKRNKIVGIIAMSVTLAASFVLDFAKEMNLVLIGFVFLFGISAIGRYVSAYYFTKHYEPELKLKKDEQFGFFKFVKNAPFNNYGRFVIYIGLITLSVNIAGPFFTPYMLRELGFSYATFTIINVSAGLFTIVSLSLWGKIGDTYGNRKLLKIGSVGISLLPVLWLFNQSPLYLIFVVQLLSGISWGAFNLGISNYIYDAVTPQKRAACVAYFTMVNGIGVFIGALLGGFILDNISITLMNSFFLIFLISGILRGVVSLIFLPLLKEVREISSESIEKMTTANYIALLTPRPFFGVFRGVRGSLASVGNYLNGIRKKE